MSAFFLNHPGEKDLALFAGGELGPLSRWRIERHLERCTACAETVADFFHLQDEISPLGELPEVDWNALAEKIEARVAAESAPAGISSPRPLPVGGWALGLAAACALAAVVWVGQRSSSSDEVPAEVARLETPAPSAELQQTQPPPRDEQAEEFSRTTTAPTAEADSAPASAELADEAAARKAERGAAAPTQASLAVARANEPELWAAAGGAVTLTRVSADGVLTITELY